MKWAFGPLVNTLQIPIPLPPLATQRAIVAEIEAEQALVSANRELITRFEQKIQTTLARVWGEEGPSATPHASPVRRARPQAPPPPVAEEADEEAEAGSEEGAEKEHPSAEAEEGGTTAPLRPTRPDEMDKSDFMSLLRDVLTEHGPCDRDTVIKQAATSLGYQRVRGGLAGILANAIRTAVRRQVLLNGGNIYSVNRAGIADLDMEFLKTQFLAAISEQGRVWTTREDATRAKFTGDWCRTGDLARRDAGGYLWYEGRADDVFKSAGYRIGPGEIENCLVKHPAVANAAVVPKPDRERGAVVKAYVVLSADFAAQRALQPGAGAAGVSAFDWALMADLQAHVKGLLAPYEYPKEIEFIDALPMTTTGKVQRRVLRLQEEVRHAGRGL